MKKMISVIMAAAIIGTMGLTASAQTVRTGVASQLQQALENKKAEVQQKVQERQNEIDKKNAELEQKAQERQNEIDKKIAEIEQKKQQFPTKEDECKAYKQELIDKKKELITNKGLNQDLLKENRQLREQLRTALKETKESGVALPEETVAALNGYKDQIKTISEKLKKEKGKILELIKQNRELIKNKDYVQMDLIYDQINAIQQTRNDLLKEINDVLVKMVELI